MSGRLRALFDRALDRRAGRLLARLDPELPPGTTVLDVGSGTGHVARAIRARTGVPCLEADVVDFHTVGPGPILFDGASLPFGDGAVVACLLAFVLNHANDPAALLREAGRVASRRILVFQSTCRGPFARPAYRARAEVQGPLAFAACRGLGLIPPVRWPGRPHHLTDRASLARLAREAGLAVVRIDPERPRAGISRDLLVLRPGDARPTG